MGIYIYREQTIIKSHRYTVLQSNLNSVGKKWSNSMDKIIEKAADEGMPFLKSVLILGYFCIFLSWFGIFFFFITTISFQNFNSSMRKQLLLSRLAEENLSSTEIQTLIDVFLKDIRER